MGEEEVSMRKEYCKPEVRTEKLAVGVFGSYNGGGNDEGGNGGGSNWSPVNFLNPLFQICCS
jgi:hypothetical protein